VPDLDETKQNAAGTIIVLQRMIAEQTYALIVAELAEDIDSRQPVIADVKKRIRSLRRKIAPVEKRLKRAEFKVTECETEIARWTAQVSSDELYEGIDAELMLDKLTPRLEVLRQKALDIRDELQPLQAEWQKERWQLETETKYIGLLRSAMLSPFTDPFAQMTTAYKGYRVPMVLCETLVGLNRDNPEWASCQAMLGEILLHTGLRDKDWSLVDPSKVDLTYMKDHLRHVDDKQAKDTALPGAEVIGQYQRDFESWRAIEDERREVIEDRRPKAGTRHHLPEMMQIPWQR
jgi:hypothetical protein